MDESDEGEDEYIGDIETETLVEAQSPRARTPGKRWQINMIRGTTNSSSA